MLLINYAENVIDLKDKTSYLSYNINEGMTNDKKIFV